MTRPEHNYLKAKHVRELIERWQAQGRAHALHVAVAREIERRAKLYFDKGRVEDAVLASDIPLLRAAFAAAKRALG